MGRVSIWAQWSIIGAGILLCPLFVVLMAGVIGRTLFRKLWRTRGVAPRKGTQAGPPQFRQRDVAP
jgi:hypothetical protein